MLRGRFQNRVVTYVYQLNFLGLILFILEMGSLDTAHCFEKVVIWGYRLHTHTHSYIHERFYRAFQHLGYPTYWYHDDDDVSRIDFSNTLFLTTGLQDTNIPLRDDCLYILHHCDMAKYKQRLNESQYISFEFYTDYVLNNPNARKIDELIYYDLPARAVHMPFASDLLPFEIEEIKKALPTRTKTNEVPWIGSYWGGEGGNLEQLTPFKTACEENGLAFIHSNPWKYPIDRNVANARYFRAFMAPAIVNRLQVNYGYVPCRLFITISCGQMGITNSSRAYELFDHKIVYNHDTYQLFFDAKKRLETWTLEDQYELMDFVKNKHTYLNRIQTLFDFFKIVNSKE